MKSKVLKSFILTSVACITLATTPVVVQANDTDVYMIFADEVEDDVEGEVENEEDGQVEGQEEVSSQTTKPDVPKDEDVTIGTATGDETNIMIYAAIGVVALIGAITAILLKRKNEE